MSDKKKSAKSSSSKDKKASSSKDNGSKKGSGKDSTASLPSEPSNQPASSDFEAGLLFSKYDKDNKGMVTAEDFRKLMMEYAANKEMAATATAAKTSAAPVAPVSTPATGAPETLSAGQPGSFAFEAGKIFAQYDRGDGRVDKQAFENMLLNHPELIGSISSPPSNPTVQPTAPGMFEGLARSLTHFDETAGVAIPASSVSAHQAMGNSVVPLVESYSNRYSRLRTMLTAKLLPKREHLLQLRRQLQVAALEVEAAKKGIENETLSDTQQILDRLKQVESLRQSAIKHQLLQLDKELQAIDRVVHRVEAANNINPFNGASTNYSGISMIGSSPSTASISSASGQAISRMVEIIQQYGELSATVDRLATKQISVQSDFRTDDFPKETAERLEVISKCDKYLHALSVKDQMLWVALQEKKKAEDSLEQERSLSEGYAQEIAQWAEMAQQMATQIRNDKSEKRELERRVEELTGLLRENRIFVDTKLSPHFEQY